jgi:hypothetical protein
VKVLIGLKVVEVAHDIQQQVSRYITNLGLVNSFDTWHGKIFVTQKMVSGHYVMGLHTNLPERHGTVVW